MTRKSPILLAAVAVASATAARADDTGAGSVQATVSGYMEVTAGGPARLSGSVGGSIIGNKAPGQPLTGLTVRLGEIGPANRNAFVKVTLPLQLRTNAPYALSISATQIPVSGDKVSSADIGFGISRPRRGAATVRGTDTPAARAVGDPTLDPDAKSGTRRWDFASGKRLSDYGSATEILRGDRVMQPVPAEVGGGVEVELYFCLKPQFFAPGSFSTAVTMTLSSP